MGFGSNVAALIDTYSQCLDLLKVFKRSNARATRGVDDDRQSLLRRSLRSDRAKIERNYSSRLSESGSRLAKGDARAKSALSQILKKLKTAIQSLLRSSSQPRLDYDALRALSNSSRIDAIRTIDQLSQRLGSPSADSVVSTSPRRSSSSRHKHEDSSSSTASSKRSEGRLRKATQSKSTEEKSRNQQKLSKHERRPSQSPKSDNRTHGRTSSGASKSTVQNRVSLATISTTSTRLGEIPEAKRRLRYTTTESSSEEYNVAAVYPLRPYSSAQPEVKEKRLWGFFRRRSGD